MADSDSDELFIGGVDVGAARVGADISSASGVSEDDDIELYIASNSPSPARARKRQRSRPPLVTTGRFWALVSEVTGGEERVHGVAQVSWDLTAEGGPLGAVVYAAEQMQFLDSPTQVPDRGSARCFTVSAINACGAQPLRCASASSASPTTVRSFVMSQGVASIDEVIRLSAAEMEALKAASGPGPCHFRSVAVHTRSCGSGFIVNRPGNKILKRWRQQRKGEDRQEASNLATSAAPREGGPSHETALPDLSLPPGVTPESLEDVAARDRRRARNVTERETLDPVKLVHAVAFASHLRSPKYFSEALDEAEEFLGLDRDDFAGRDRGADPTRFPLMKALARADAVCCLLQRRLFVTWFQQGLVKCICIYSDASPVVGVEIQGMVIDVIFHDKGFERIVLPGSTLAYGSANTVAKGVALLWAIFLVAGPTPQALRTFCDHVISFTTDFGVEMHLLEMPDIIDAFVAWVSGVPLDRLRPLVNQNTRMFPRALRMAGWSHTLGGIMKEVANSMDEWPHSLKHMRALCKNFRNATYRNHIYSKLRDRGPANLHRLMKSFSASFAKWRYETVPAVQA